MNRKNPPAQFAGVGLILLFFALLAIPGGIFAQEIDGDGQEAEGLWVFQNTVPGPHRGTVNSLQHDGQRILSAGEDGFVELWEQGQAVLRFQISSLPISATAIRPGKTQIACIETDDLGQYRISAWDYRSLENLFTLRFRDPVQNISYSAGGTYLIISRSGTTGLVLVDGDTGELVLDPRNIPEDFPSTVSFAAIGRTERVLLTYSPSGVLSYWELRMEGEARLVPSYSSGTTRPLNFDVPANLSSPVLFGNNRFFAGIDRGGLVILRADTGAELARDSAIVQGSKLSGLGAELYCLVKAASGSLDSILRFRMNNSDRVERRDYFSLPALMNATVLLPFSSGTYSQLVLGTAEGELLTADPRYSLYAAQKLTTRTQTRIPEIAIGARRIAFLTGTERLGYIPLDFLELGSGDTISLEASGAYTRITSAGIAGAESLSDRFLLWQDEAPLPLPVFRSPGQGDTALGGLEARQSGGAFSRFPLRSVSVLEDQGLFLDTRGNISVLSLKEGGERYAESIIGAIAAAFIDRESVVLGRSAPFSLGITAPFLKIDIKTGETVPIPYPASTGVQVYRGASGSVYGVTVEQADNSLRTSIVRLDTREGINSARLVEYNGEDTRCSVAEADGFLASTIGGSEAGIYAPWGMIPLERGPGLPQSIADGELYFIVLDAEGCVFWHDPRTGNILAVFRLYEDQWTLRTAWAPPIWGGVIR